jgi:hypothetical protein
MKCWNCSADSVEVVKGPPDLAVCHSCIKNTDEATDLLMVGTCTFCSRTLGARYGGFWQKRRHACLVRDSQTLCDDCLRLMKDIVELEEEERAVKESHEKAKRESTFSARTERAPAVPLAGCVLCRLPKEAEELTYIPDRGLICNVCLDAIRAVIEESKERKETT